VNRDQKRKEVALHICKEFFNRGSVLYNEKELYMTLVDSHDIDSPLLEKLLEEAKKEYAKLDRKEIFNMQTRMINKVNKSLTGEVFNNFVSNYKNLATISQILSQDLPVKKRVILENLFIKNHSAESKDHAEQLEPTDNLVYKTFVENYNKKYEDRLLEEQKEVITRYATSFSDNGVSLKIYLNEEFGRLKNVLNNSLVSKIIKEDANMLSKAQEVLGIVESYGEKCEFDEDVIIQILEIQNLAKEIES
tara:strand:- start:40 stop:786 length:747 start_codon:yes stop_codon:yes gene_type:complete